MLLQMALFLWVSNILLCACVRVFVCVHHLFFILSLVNRHLDYFHVLAIVSSAATLFFKILLYKLRRRQWHPTPVLAWEIPWTEEPGGLQSMGSQRVGHDWVTSLSLFTFMHWRRKWQPTPVFLPGESQGRQSLVGCHLWGRTKSDTTEAT